MGFLTLLLGILMIATSSIGIQCINKSETKTSSNKKFLIAMLVIAILAALFQLIRYGIKYAK